MAVRGFLRGSDVTMMVSPFRTANSWSGRSYSNAYKIIIIAHISHSPTPRNSPAVPRSEPLTRARTALPLLLTELASHNGFNQTLRPLTVLADFRLSRRLTDCDIEAEFSRYGRLGRGVHSYVRPYSSAAPFATVLSIISRQAGTESLFL